MKTKWMQALKKKKEKTKTVLTEYDAQGRVVRVTEREGSKVDVYEIQYTFNGLPYFLIYNGKEVERVYYNADDTINHCVSNGAFISTTPTPRLADFMPKRVLDALKATKSYTN
jgi:hypothetical protein